MTDKKKKLGILISGSGTNLQAIIDASKDKSIPAEVALVISDNANAGGISRAEKANIPVQTILRKNFSSKDDFEKNIVHSLLAYEVDLVCLAGFMRIIGKILLKNFRNKIINIHPSLLPAFPGLAAQKQAFDYGVKVSGCTVHFVDEEMDHGPIIIQKAAEVMEDDSSETLQQRILRKEHKIYPEAIKLFCENRLKIENRRVYILPKKS